MKNFALVAVQALALAPATAYAYLDPGTGSFILQMAIAGLLGAIALCSSCVGSQPGNSLRVCFFVAPGPTDANGDNSTRGDENVDEVTK